MTLYHFNPDTLQGGPCGASLRSCPFGDENHYTSEEALQQAISSRTKVLASLKRGKAIPETLRGIFEETTALTKDEFAKLASLKAMKPVEVKVLRLLEESAYAEERGYSFEQKRELMSHISGLHFAKGQLSPYELIMLGALERLQKGWLRSR